MSDEPISTAVGWLTHGDNLFRGHSVKDEIFGRANRWGSLSLGLGHRLLSDAESAFLDDLSAAVSAADPRIWPLKAVWLVGCYGSALAAMAAGHHLLARATMGPAVATEVGRLWHDLDLHLAAVPAPRRRDALVAFFTRRRAEGDLPPGFGSVPGRPEDERLPLLRAAVEKHGRAQHRYHRLACEAGEVFPSCGMQSNLMGTLTACLLDLGFAIDQLAPMAFNVMSHTLWANAYEAARLRPRSLKCLHPDAVVYVGPPPRTTGRKRAGRGGAGRQM